MANLKEILADLKALRHSKAGQKGGLVHGDDSEWKKYAIEKVNEDRKTLAYIIEKLEALIG